MRASPLLLALVLFGTSPERAPAQEEPEGKNPELPYQKLGPIMDNLPAGSMLKEVRIPVFNKKLERMALLQSDFLKVLTKRDLRAENIALRYFQDDSVLIRMRMGSANFSLNTGILRAHKVITLRGGKIRGQGAGGIFHLESRSGFLRGPVSTLLAASDNPKGNPPASGKNEHPPENPLSPAGLSELATAFTGPEGLTGTERRKIDTLLQSRTRSVLANRAPTRNFMTQSRQSSGKADADLRSFSHTIQIPESKLLSPVSQGNPVTPPPVKATRGEVLITAEGGMFLNPERGHISYLRNIEVTESRFTLTCAGHLKVFFPPQDLSKAIRNSDTSSRDNTPPVEGESREKEKTFSELVDPYLFVISGGVRVALKDPSGRNPPSIATGETAVVNRRTGDIVLQGGTPTIRQGLNSLTAGSPDLYLRLYQNGDFYAEEGLWTTVGDLSALKHLGNGADTREKPGREDGKPQLVVVTSRGGLYFDAREGHIVYLKDVKVQHPQFHIQADDEIKIFLGRKPEASGGDLAGPEAFSDITHVVASGRVRLIREDPDGKRAAVIATAQHAILDVATANIMLRGGTPAISQGDNSLRGGKPDLYMRFYENGSLFAEPGPWITTGDLANLRRRKGEKKKTAELITVTCEGGFYFDAIKGEVVYLGEIVVQEPRFRLRCSDSMRITLTRREETTETRLKGPEAFSDVDKIVALGNVFITRIPGADAQPVVANSAAATYEARSGILALRGGRPGIRQGKSFFEARENGLYILFHPNGSFELSRGAWEQFFDLKDKNFEKLRNEKTN
ncbi:MAG: hypothetical protein VYC57_06385 [Verrucomicrobiota bacterium]|nr:hypothetical protein [Verrucomicrobiota bacterium]